MSRKIFVNLPVRDLAHSIGFFEALGFRINPRFTDETAACLVITDDIHVLLTHAKFGEFTRKEIADATKVTEVLTCLTVESRADVDRLIDAALEADGTEARAPMDHDFMYGRSFNDLDGHIWEIVRMDPAAVPSSESMAAMS